MASEGSTKAVLYALGANGGIAISKLVAAVYTGSGAMLAEAIHSIADCANQLLLLLGLRQARRPVSPEYPLGHGRVVYFWAMMVALLLFFVGGAFSVYEGIHRWMAPEPLESAPVALLVLGVAVVLESFSLWGALREINKERQGRPFLRWFRETRQSSLLVVAGEDTAALAGLAIAFGAVLMSIGTGDPRWDAAGSIGVGLLLMLVAWAILREVKGMIVGQSTSPEAQRAICDLIESQPEVVRLTRLTTLQWGERVVVAVHAQFRPLGSDHALVAAAARVRQAVEAQFPQVGWVVVQPEAD